MGNLGSSGGYSGAGIFSTAGYNNLVQGNYTTTSGSVIICNMCGTVYNSYSIHQCMPQTQTYAPGAAVQLNNNKPKSTMYNSLTEKFMSILAGEPKNTLIKEGIIYQNGTLTAEGRELFTNWLFSTQMDAFKTAVIDPIIADRKASK